MNKIFFVAASIYFFSPYGLAAELSINAKNCNHLHSRPGNVADAKGNQIITFYCKANESIRKLAPIESQSKDYKIELTNDGYVEITPRKSKFTKKDRMALYSQFDSEGFKVGSSAVRCVLVNENAIKYKGQIFLRSEAQPVPDQGVGLESGAVK